MATALITMFIWTFYSPCTNIFKRFPFTYNSCKLVWKIPFGACVVHEKIVPDVREIDDDDRQCVRGYVLCRRHPLEQLTTTQQWRNSWLIENCRQG